MHDGTGEPRPSGVRVVRAGLRRVVVGTPNVRQYGHLANEIGFALAWARLTGLPLVLRRPRVVPSEAMFSIEADGVEIDRSHTTRALVEVACVFGDRADAFRDWRWRAYRDLLRQLLHDLGTFRSRHSKNVLVKWKASDLKVARQQRELARAEALGPPRPYWRRRLIAESAGVRLSADGARRAHEAAVRAGIDPEARLVAVHVRERGYKLGNELQDKGGGRDDSVRNARLETHFPALDGLVAEGYTIVRVGDPSMTPLSRPGYVDIASAELHDSYLELHCLARSEFLLCGESGPLGAAYLMDTPILLANVTDPVSGLPVRQSGIALFKTILDRETDEPLTLAELLSEEHFLHLRTPSRYLYVENTAEEISDAVVEMRALLAHGTPESSAQLRYKAALTEAIAANQHIAYVRKWGLDDGFLGDGRLAQQQAERWCGEGAVAERARAAAFAAIAAATEERERAAALLAAPRPAWTIPGNEPAAEGRRVLFVMQHLGFLRHYGPALRLLADRGHRIHVAYLEDRPNKGERAFGEEFLRGCPTATIGPAPAPAGGPWAALAHGVRLLVDYARYFDSRYANARILRARGATLLPRAPRRLFAALGDRGIRALIAVLRRIELALPADPAARELLEEHRPDLLLVSPLVEFASPLVDWVKAARALGVPSGLCVASWDNLTNKGHMRVVPDRIFVWNEPQREEAIALHGADPESVVVTGAQLFDHWFDWQPRRTREEFCRTAGLDPDRPFVVFLGSTAGVAPAEVYFVERWLRSVRDCGDPDLAGIGMLIRPHPANADKYLSLDLTHQSNVSIWPPMAKSRSDYYAPAGQNDFFESLYYSSAAVGVNTSALIEAAIVGRSVCTLRADGLDLAQDGTLHFAHLVDERTGMLRTADSVEGHLSDLRDVVFEGGGGDRSRRFVEHFVRPHGIDRPATPILAEALEAAARLRVAERPETAGDRFLRVLLRPLAGHVTRVARRRHERRQPLWLRLGRPLLLLWVRLVAVGAFLDRAHWTEAKSVYGRRVARRTRGLRRNARRGAHRLLKRRRRIARRVLRAPMHVVLALARRARRVARRVARARSERDFAKPS